jgi:hypothetical protein
MLGGACCSVGFQEDGPTRWPLVTIEYLLNTVEYAVHAFSMPRSSWTARRLPMKTGPLTALGIMDAGEEMNYA